MTVLGFDTSNYTTSVAYFDGTQGCNCSKLLPVKMGELGLRQSDAVFAHIKSRSFPAGCFPRPGSRGSTQLASAPVHGPLKAATCLASWLDIPMPNSFLMPSRCR